VSGPAPRRIVSRDNPAVRDLIRFAGSSRARRAAKVALLDGPHLIAELIRSGGEAVLLCASEAGLRREEVRRLFESAPALERLILADRLFDAAAPVATPVGVLALARLPDPQPLPPRLGDAVVLDGVQDAGNAGTMLRTAAAAGVGTVIAAGRSVDLWSPKVLRAAMGAHFRLSLFEGSTAAAWAERAAGAVIATTAEGGESLYACDLRSPAVWVFGSEGAGIGAAARSAATRRVRVPMAEGVESLNVAVTAAVCLFEQRRQRLGDRPVAGGRPA